MTQEAEIIMGMGCSRPSCWPGRPFILAARSKLVSSGDVTIDINGDPEKRMDRVRRRQAAADAGRMKRSSCRRPAAAAAPAAVPLQGGHGGGDILPTESPFHQARNSRRLAAGCQLAVKQDMKIEVAGGVLRRQEVGVRRSSPTTTSRPSSRSWCSSCPRRGRAFPRRRLCAARVPGAQRHYRTSISSRRIPRRLGKVQAAGPEAPDDETTIRAYSMANYPEEKGLLKFNIRIATPPPGQARDSARQDVVLGVQPQEGRQGDRVRTLWRILRARYGCTRWSLSAAAPAWRRCVRTSSTS
jgi:Na+-transporting NADH:ubiquinone oxidoreductase subunit F